MVAPRLLDKKIANAEVAMQRTQQIKQGLNLSKKVDALRETFSVEESNLEKFRTESIAAVKKEIDAKLQERDILERENLILRNERIELLGPIDLSKAWKEVNSGKEEIESWKQRLSQEQVEILSKKEENALRSEELELREQNAKRKDILLEMTLATAVSNLETSEKRLALAKDESSILIQEAKKKNLSSNERGKDLEVWSQRISEIEQTNIEHENELLEREMRLKVRYDTLIKAQNYINRRNK